jgi:hypothetical protein
MAGKATRYLSLGFSALFVICAAMACFLMFQAGYTGDSKGAQGDPNNSGQTTISIFSKVKQ